jgi:transposase
LRNNSGSLINAIRAHLAEFGIVAPVGRHGVEQLLSVAADANDKRLAMLAIRAVANAGPHRPMLRS